MLKKVILAFAASTFASSAFANCYGGSRFYSCNDLASGSFSNLLQFGDEVTTWGVGGQPDDILLGNRSLFGSVIASHEISPINNSRLNQTLNFGPHGYDTSGNFFSGGSLWD